MGCHFLLQGNLPDPGIEPRSPALQVDTLPSELPGNPTRPWKGPRKDSSLESWEHDPAGTLIRTTCFQTHERTRLYCFKPSRLYGTALCQPEETNKEGQPGPRSQETQVRSLGQEDSPGEGNGSPLQYSCLENSMDREAWWATVHGVTKNQT